MTYKEFYEACELIVDKVMQDKDYQFQDAGWDLRKLIKRNDFKEESVRSLITKEQLKEKIEDALDSQPTYEHKKDLINILEILISLPKESFPFAQDAIDCWYESYESEVDQPSSSDEPKSPQEQPNPLTKEEIEGNLKDTFVRDLHKEYQTSYWDNIFNWGFDGDSPTYEENFPGIYIPLLKNLILHPDNAWLFRQEVIDALKEPEKPKKKTWGERFVTNNIKGMPAMGSDFNYICEISSQDMAELKEIHKKWEQE